MNWLLLPPEANAGRHLPDEARLSSGSWTRWLRCAWEWMLHPHT